jgi:hypothetical protein
MITAIHLPGPGLCSARQSRFPADFAAKKACAIAFIRHK